MKRRNHGKSELVTIGAGGDGPLQEAAREGGKMRGPRIVCKGNRRVSKEGGGNDSKKSHPPLFKKKKHYEAR